MQEKINIFVQLLDGRFGTVSVSPYDPVYSIGEFFGLNQQVSFPYLVLFNGKVIDHFLSFQIHHVKDGDNVILFTFPETTDFSNFDIKSTGSKTDSKLKDRIDKMFAEVMRICDLAKTPVEYTKPDKRKIYIQPSEVPVTKERTIISKKADNISKEELPFQWEISNKEDTDGDSFNPKEYINRLFSSRL